MKTTLLSLLVVLSVEFNVAQSRGFTNSLTVGIDRSTGRLIGTDVWNSRAYDYMTDKVGGGHQSLCYFLGSTFALETNGTRLEASVIIGLYTLEDATVNRLIWKLWIEANDGARSLGGTYYGTSNGGYPDHRDDSKPLSSLTIEPLRREPTKGGQVLWIVKVTFPIELQRSVDFIPNLEIQCGSFLYYVRGNQDKTTISALKQELQKRTVSATSPAKATKPVSRSAPAAKFNPTTTTSAALPEISVSIAEKDGFLLVTFSPVVTNANLEQADVNSYPWAWEPALTATNVATNGWFVVPTLQPRVFRVRIDR